MGRRRRQRRGSGAAQTGLCGLGLLVPQVPLDDEALAFGVAGDSLAVAAELGVWGSSSCSRARARWRNSSMRRPSPKTPCTSQWARPAPGTRLSRAAGAEAILRALRVVTLDEHSVCVHRTEEQSCGPSRHKQERGENPREVDSAANGVMPLHGGPSPLPPSRPSCPPTKGDTSA
jgi:hypothetical protein